MNILNNLIGYVTKSMSMVLWNTKNTFCGYLKMKFQKYEQNQNPMMAF